MPITNKAEEEALSVEEMKTELESRGLLTEGLKQAIMLDYLKHLVAGAATKGDSTKEVAEPNGNSKDDAAPENGESTKGEESNKNAVPDAVILGEDPKKDKIVAPAEPASAEEPADKPADESVAPAAEGAAPTRPADEVSGGTEQPAAKKPKADVDLETAELSKTVRIPADTPVADRTAPERAAHIDKSRVAGNYTEMFQRNEKRRKHEEGEEEEEEEGGGRKPSKKERVARKDWSASRDRCKNVSAIDRVKQFPGQTLLAERGELMCEACGRKPLSVYKETIKNHVRGTWHKKALEKFQPSQASKQNSLVYSKEYSAAAGAVYGSTLSPKEISGQALMTKGCLSAGIAFNALDNPAMKEALLHFGVKLPPAAHLANHIPFILSEETKTILEELGEGTYTVVFDGTPYRCECFGVGIRFIGSDGKICQRILSLSMFAKSMDFKAIFGEVHKVLFNKFNLDAQRCRGFMLDGCAANLRALLALTTHCANAVGLRCMSHLFNNTGDKIESAQIDKFAGALHTVLSHSANASQQWRTATKTPPPKAPSHRWASAYERNDQMVRTWQGMKTFIDVFSTSDETKSTKAKFCREELARVRPDGIHLEFPLQLEFALAMDLGVHLARATYLLEGDEMLLPLAYEAILGVRMGLALTLEGDETFGRPHLPNVDALIRAYCRDDAAMKAMFEEQVRKDMKAVQMYAWERIGDHSDAEQHETIAIYKAGRLFNFRYVKQHKLTAEDINLLSEPLPFITEEVISELVAEKDEYQLAASSVDVEYDLWEFWRNSRARLPHWYNVAKDIALMQPSAAFMERVFSVLRACMDERQESGYSDRIAASALLKYNRGRGK